MKVLDKKVTQNRERNRENQLALAAADMCIKAAILVIDDMWGANEEITDRFIHGYAEVINGYGEEGGIAALNQELIERGINVDLEGY